MFVCNKSRFKIEKFTIEIKSTFDQNLLLNLIYVLVCRDEFGMYLPSPAFSMHNNPPTPQKRRLVT